MGAAALGGGAVALSLASGLLVGFSLGLTGGGGSIFAVPLLVYGLGVPAQQAIGISLAAVGATALWGAIQRLRAGEVELKTALLFSAAGMLGAPAGTWLRGQMPETLLLVLFAGLMILVAARMWLKSQRTSAESIALTEPVPTTDAGPTCHRDPEGRLHLTSRCMLLLAVVGLATGVLSGLFGVGGGFVIVPALVFFSGMGIHRAVATSLLVISLVSVSGVASHLAAGCPLPLLLTLLFLAGGVIGMVLGTRLSRRLSPTGLQKLFAIAILVVAAYILFKNIAGL